MYFLLWLLLLAESYIKPKQAAWTNELKEHTELHWNTDNLIVEKKGNNCESIQAFFSSSFTQKVLWHSNIPVSIDNIPVQSE